MPNRDTSAPVSDPVSIDVKRSTAPKDANSPRLLGTLWWSEKSGGLFIRQRRRMQRKWLGLTGQEWGLFCRRRGLGLCGWVGGVAGVGLTGAHSLGHSIALAKAFDDKGVRATMTGDDFTAWMKMMGFKAVDAAEALGVHRNTIPSYKKDGTNKSIGLACAALAVGLSEWTDGRAASATVSPAASSPDTEADLLEKAFATDDYRIILETIRLLVHKDAQGA